MGKPVIERSKVIIKNLPPSLSEADFLSAIEAACEGQYTSLRYVQGRQSAKGSRTSRAYLYMKEPLMVFDLRANFDGHSFVNERGQQYRCSVEYAPYQKSPKVVTKKDPREGTLEKDTAYQDFLARLEKDPNVLPSQASEAVESTSSHPPASTAEGARVSALMLYMQQKWAGKLEPQQEISKSAARQKKKSRKNEDKAQSTGAKSREMRPPDLAPPPGFDSIPLGTPSASAPSAATSSSKKSRRQKKEERSAESKDVKPSGEIARQASTQSSETSRKKGEKPPKGGRSEDGREGALSGSKDDAPKRLLVKDSSKATSRQDPKAAKESKPPPADSKDASQKQKASRPVKAGFQPYTPKPRSQA